MRLSITKIYIFNAYIIIIQIMFEIEKILF